MYLCLYIEDNSIGIMLSIIYSARFLKLEPYLRHYKAMKNLDHKHKRQSFDIESTLCNYHVNAK